MPATFAQLPKTLLVLAAALGACLAHAQHAPSDSSEPAWIEAPAPLPAGARIALLKGELSKPGPLAFRLKLPPEYRLAPHASPAMRRIVVVSGALYLGAGDTFDSARAVPLHAGYVHWPNNGTYFAFTRDETVVEVEGTGPWTLRYIDARNEPGGKRQVSRASQ